MPRVPFADLTPDTLDFQLSPSKSAKDFMAVLTRHIDETAALERNPDLEVTRDIHYGPAPRQTLDIARPRNKTKMPAFLFIHGGFWQEGSKDGSGFAAPDLAAHGWCHIGIGYRLTPAVRLRDIVADIVMAITWVRDHADAYDIDPSRLVLAGHSAGAHLVAAIVTGQAQAQMTPMPGVTGTIAESVAAAILISGVYDLAPIAASYVNALAAIDATEIEDLSPLYAAPQRDIPVRLLIGGDEPDAFQRQTDALLVGWERALTDITCERVPGCDHFDILDAVTPNLLPRI